MVGPSEPPIPEPQECWTTKSEDKDHTLLGIPESRISLEQAPWGAFAVPAPSSRTRAPPPTAEPHTKGSLDPARKGGAALVSVR